MFDDHYIGPCKRPFRARYYLWLIALHVDLYDQDWAVGQTETLKLRIEVGNRDNLRPASVVRQDGVAAAIRVLVVV